MAKVPLKCTRTHGPYNKGDVIAVHPETAKSYLAAKNTPWAEVKKAAKSDADGTGGAGGADGTGGAK